MRRTSSVRGLLASDDVLNPPSVTGIFRDGAFAAFCRERKLHYTTFRNLGLALPGARSFPGELAALELLRGDSLRRRETSK